MSKDQNQSESINDCMQIQGTCIIYFQLSLRIQSAIFCSFKNNSIQSGDIVAENAYSIIQPTAFTRTMLKFQPIKLHDARTSNHLPHGPIPSMNSSKQHSIRFQSTKSANFPIIPTIYGYPHTTSLDQLETMVSINTP